MNDPITIIFNYVSPIKIVMYFSTVFGPVISASYGSTNMYIYIAGDKIIYAHNLERSYMLNGNYENISIITGYKVSDHGRNLDKIDYLPHEIQSANDLPGIIVNDSKSNELVYQKYDDAHEGTFADMKIISSVRNMFTRNTVNLQKCQYIDINNIYYIAYDTGDDFKILAPTIDTLINTSIQFKIEKYENILQEFEYVLDKMRPVDVFSEHCEYDDAKPYTRTEYDDKIGMEVTVPYYKIPRRYSYSHFNMPYKYCFKQEYGKHALSDVTICLI